MCVSVRWTHILLRYGRTDSHTLQFPSTPSHAGQLDSCLAVHSSFLIFYLRFMTLILVKSNSLIYNVFFLLRLFIVSISLCCRTFWKEKILEILWGKNEIMKIFCTTFSNFITKPEVYNFIVSMFRVLLSSMIKIKIIYKMNLIIIVRLYIDGSPFPLKIKK